MGPARVAAGLSQQPVERWGVGRHRHDGAEAFAALECAVSPLGLTTLRLHDVLLWLSAGLRLTHAVALGRTAV